MSVKTKINAIKYKRAIKRVNQAVGVIGVKYGLGYSPIYGIIGDKSSFTKNDIKAIDKSARVMKKYDSGYYKDKQKFDNETPINNSRYVPLGLSDHVEVQKTAYEQACSSMHLRAPIKFLQRTNFDPRLQAHPNRRVLDMTPEDAQEWAALTESLWRDDKGSKSWDESEINNYSQLADLAFYKYVAIGEFFAVRRTYHNDPFRLSNLSIQLISPFQVQSPVFSSYNNYNISYYDYDCKRLVEVNSAQYLLDLPDGNYIESGIEYDKKNREVAIYVAPSRPLDSWLRISVYNDNGFKQVLHGFIQSEEGQKRGIPESAYSYHEYVMAEDLEKFEMESARLNTVIAGAVTADSNAAPGGASVVDQIGTGDNYWGTDTEKAAAAGVATPSFTTRAVEGGGFILQKFDPGYKYNELKTDRPNINIPEFLDKIFEFLYPSNFGLSIVTVKQRFDGSYNASKGAIDLSWKNGIEYFLKQFTSDFHYENYVAWLNGKIANGRIAAAGWEDPEKRNAWSSMTIITPAKPSLNPAAESTASKNRIEQGISNREIEAQQTTGTSFEENVERLSTDNPKLAEANSSLNPVVENSNDDDIDNKDDDKSDNKGKK